MLTSLLFILYRYCICFITKGTVSRDLLHHIMDEEFQLPPSYDMLFVDSHSGVLMGSKNKL